MSTDIPGTTQEVGAQSSDSKSNGPAKPAAVQVVKAQKEPPPESSDSIWARRYIVLAFWLVVVVLGLPLWWKTTTVYRAALPISEMNAWAEGNNCQPKLSVPVHIDAPALSDAETSSLLHGLQSTLDSTLNRGIHSVRVEKAKPPQHQEAPPAMTVRLVRGQGIPDPIASFSPHAAHTFLDVFYDHATHAAEPGPLIKVITESLFDCFAEEKAVVAYQTSSSPNPRAPSNLTQDLNEHVIRELEKRKTRSMKYASTYHLTFSLFTPEGLPSDWEIEQALSDTFTPLLKALAPISNFTIDTQVQLYAAFSQSVQPTYNEQSKQWQLRSSDLGGFINAAEWPLSPSIGADPTINFILYVPSASQTPLVIEESESTSWLIRQWGGIAIYNPKSPQQLQKRGRLTANEMREPLLTFSQHLLDLLGLPSTDLPFQLRLSGQSRSLTLRLIASASATLGSLARLTEELPSISIPESVAEAVAATISHLEASCTALNAARFQEALEHARTADAEVEHAFFHKSMVGQVYFPDEHKVAVYLPMLGPMAVPLIMTAVRELKSLRTGPAPP